MSINNIETNIKEKIYITYHDSQKKQLKNILIIIVKKEEKYTIKE